MQTSNPAVETTITGFKAVSLPFMLDSYKNKWVGLGRDGTAKTDSFIDDAPSGTYWWTAIGATKYHGGADTIPGPYPHVVTKVELYVFNKGNCLDDNIMS